VSVVSHARAGAQRYRALLALPDARAPVVLSAAGSMPIGMFGLGILLLARDATGSFAEAGRVVGAFMVMAIVVGTALGNAAGRSIVESSSYDTAVLWAGAAAGAGAALTLARRRTLLATTAA
jgi:predicted MFS family arabinose efflux permease